MRLVLVLFLFVVPGHLSAQSFERCDKAQIDYASAAFDGAARIVMFAGAAVGDTPEYARWFGEFTPANAEKVRAGLKAVHRALGMAELHLVCPAPGEDGCTIDTYANVLPDRPYVVNLCAAFFRQPTMGGVVTSSFAFDSGTREGTLIHEVSHFIAVANTDDNCYGREVCTDMAKTEPLLAINNADSFQYFAEDVVLSVEGRLP